MKNQTIVIGSDHRGFSLKSLLIDRIKNLGYSVEDLGPSNDIRCDAGDYAQKLALELRTHPEHKGILICMTGQVMAMTANRYRHVRAALCLNTTMARLAREHNDANVLVLGAFITGQSVAEDCVDVFLNTAFSGGRYAERLTKFNDLGGL